MVSGANYWLVAQRLLPNHFWRGRRVSTASFASQTGYSSILTQPVSLISFTIYSEAMWSRVWASADRRALHRGALFGFVTLTVVIFLLGFGGWLAIWAGLVDANTNVNLYLLQVHVKRWRASQACYFRSSKKYSHADCRGPKENSRTTY